jgi:hypothetical protein
MPRTSTNQKDDFVKKKYLKYRKGWEMVRYFFPEEKYGLGNWEQWEVDLS